MYIICKKSKHQKIFEKRTDLEDPCLILRFTIELQLSKQYDIIIDSETDQQNSLQIDLHIFKRC